MSSPGYISSDKLNKGVRVESLTGEMIGQDGMFARSHFQLPTPPDGFHIAMPGRALRFVTPKMLETFDQIERAVVLECAGNGRAMMDPVPDGVPWRHGGVSPISVRGVRLADVLGNLPESVVDVVFTGADRGVVGRLGSIPYQYSIDRDLALSNLPILATHIGNQPLNVEHGAPVRLIVPGHYGMKSVKWLTRVEGVRDEFEGYFVKEYRFYSDPEREEAAPVDEIEVKSVISSPFDGDTWVGAMDVRGSAWTGHGTVASVEVSIDGGVTWHEADLAQRETGGPWGPVRWSAVVTAEPGTVTIMARATDTSGATQPLNPPWNSRGYANNAVHSVTVQVLED